MEGQNQIQQSTINIESENQVSGNVGQTSLQNTDSNILNLIQEHLYNKKLDYLEENIKLILPKDLLLPYKYDNSKTIIEIILENQMIDYLSEKQLNFLLRDKTAAIIFLNNEWFASSLVELLEANDNNEYIAMLLDTLNQLKDSTIFTDFVSKNFDRIKTNSLINSKIINEQIGLIFLERGVFVPFNKFYNMCLETYNGLTVLEYLFLKYQKGDKTDVGLDFFALGILNDDIYGKNYTIFSTYTKLCCKYKNFAPLLNINPEALLLHYKDDMSVLQYILSVSPNFQFEPKNNPNFTYQLVIEYIKIGNWKAITPHLKYFKQYFNATFELLSLDLPHSNEKRCIDLFIEHDVINGDESYEVVGEWLTTISEDFLLRKDENGITVLERLLKIDGKIGLKLAEESIYNWKKIQVRTGVILAKYGYYSRIDCEDQYQQDFQQYIDKLVRRFFEKKYFGSSEVDGEVKNEIRSIYNKFYQYFGENTNKSDKQIYFLAVDVFYKYLAIDKDMAIQYLTYFVERKKQDPNFSLKQNIRSHYDANTSTVNARNYNPYILVHEVGHSIHHFKRNWEYPEHIRIMIEELRNNPETISRLQSFAIRVQTAVEERRSEIIKQFFDEVCDFSYTTKIEKDYHDICGNLEGLLARFVNRNGHNLNIEAISKLLEGSEITFSDYMAMTMKNDCSEYEKGILGMEFAALFMIENLMDAIFEGKWRSEKLEGVTATCYQGHVSKYYETHSAFKEIYANFSGLMFGIVAKVDGVEEQLRYLLGDALFDALIEYYQQLNQSQGKAK